MFDFATLQSNATATATATQPGGISWGDLASIWIPPALTAAMVLATAIMAWKTRDLANETFKIRMAEYEPIIKANLRWIGPIAVSLRVQNVGKGVAKDVEIEIKEIPAKGTPRKSLQPLIAPGSSATLFLEPSYFEQLSKQFDKITVAGRCKDVLGNIHLINDIIDLRELEASIKHAPQMYELTLEDRIREVNKTLESIDRRIGTLLGYVESQGFSKTIDDAMTNNFGSWKNWIGKEHPRQTAREGLGAYRQRSD